MGDRSTEIANLKLKIEEYEKELNTATSLSKKTKIRRLLKYNTTELNKLQNEQSDQSEVNATSNEECKVIGIIYLLSLYLSFHEFFVVKRSLVFISLSICTILFCRGRYDWDDLKVLPEHIVVSSATEGLDWVVLTGLGAAGVALAYCVKLMSCGRESVPYETVPVTDEEEEEDDIELRSEKK